MSFWSFCHLLRHSLPYQLRFYLLASICPDRFLLFLPRFSLPIWLNYGLFHPSNFLLLVLVRLVLVIFFFYKGLFHMDLIYLYGISCHSLFFLKVFLFWILPALEWPYLHSHILLQCCICIFEVLFWRVCYRLSWSFTTLYFQKEWGWQSEPIRLVLQLILPFVKVCSAKPTELLRCLALSWFWFTVEKGLFFSRMLRWRVIVFVKAALNIDYLKMNSEDLWNSESICVPRCFICVRRNCMYWDTG